MRKILRILSNPTLFALVFFSNAILTWAFLMSTEETELTTNIYFLSERFDYLLMSIIGYNIVPKKYHLIVLPACAIASIRFINELLNITNIVHINNYFLLTFEFIILLIILWFISKISYE